MTPLTQARVQFIRSALDAGKSQTVIASKLGISPSYVWQLKRDYINDRSVMDRWLNVHKIGDIGKRAVEETA